MKLTYLTYCKKCNITEENHKHNKPMKRYYKVVGKSIDTNGQTHFYQLGFTSSKTAWLKNSNGWAEKDLTFITQFVKPSKKQEYLNK